MELLGKMASIYMITIGTLYRIWFSLVCILFSGHLIHGSTFDEMELHSKLFENYNRYVVPRLNYSVPMRVSVQCLLSDILNFEESANTLTWNALFSVQWKDELLTWNKSQYNVSSIKVPLGRIWLPELVIMNSVEEKKPINSAIASVMVDNDGTVQWVPSGKLKTMCELDIVKFPFDRQVCELILQPWTAAISSQVFVPPSRALNPYLFYQENAQWIVSDVRTEYKIKRSDELEYTGSVYLFEIFLQRRSSYYVLNIVLPIGLMSLLNLCCFLIPPESGEKMTLSVSLFLTFAVYITVLNNELPKSSTQVSCFVVFLFWQFFLSGVTIAMEAFVLYIFFNRMERSIWSCMKNLLSTKKGHTTDDEVITGEKSSTSKGTIELTNEEFATKLDRLFMTVVIILDVVSVSLLIFFSLL